MKIKSVESMAIGLPIKKGGEQYEQETSWNIKNVLTLNHMLVRIETECGLVGWGEAFSFRGGEPLKEIVDTLITPSLIGKNAPDIAGIHHQLQFENHLWGRYGLTMFAISAIDIALWDLAGKQQNKPIFELLGGNSNPLKSYASLIRYDNNFAAELSVRAKSEGYNAIKLHEINVDVINKVRADIGSDLILMTDTNCSWSEEDAIKNAKALKSANLMCIEEPSFPPEDYASLARIQQQGGIAIAAGECACTVLEFEAMFAAGAVTYAQPSVAKVGGISEFIKVNTLAANNDIEIMPHSPYYGPGYLATLHLMSALNPQGYIERLYLDEIRADFYNGKANPVKGIVSTPKGAGLGLDPDMDVIDQYRTK